MALSGRPGSPLHPGPQGITTKSDGTGLGLSLSYGIVQAHQGAIDVQSAPGRGTRFILTFPLAAPK